MKKIDFTKTFNSGLYEGETFYTIQEIDFSENPHLLECVEYNKELLKEYYFEDAKIEEGELQEHIEERLWEDLANSDIYYEPMIFDEEIALECGLIPFTYKGEEFHGSNSGRKMLACISNEVGHLDAYQVLTHNTIDKNSRLLSHTQDCDVVGSKVMQKILNILS